jgi:hypothetical protein
MNMYRQGDVLLMSVDSGDGDDVPREDGRIVLERGEATGHAHAIAEPNARLVRNAKTQERFLRVVETDAFLRHEEHAPIRVPPGLYRVVRQREYSPAKIKYVAD